MRRAYRNLGFGLVFAASLLICSISVRAQESDFHISGDIGAVSDYLFRGVSRSSGDPSLQATIDFAHSSGVYVGAFLSSIDNLKDQNFEIEGYLGYGFSNGPWDYNLSLGLDSFHGSHDSKAFLEIRSTISRDFGFAYVRSGLYIAPDDREIGLGRSLYVFGEGDFYVPAPGLPPITLNLKFGYEDFEGGLDKWDWSVGLFVEAGGLEWGIKYFSVSKDFVQGSRSHLSFGIKKYF